MRGALATLFVMFMLVLPATPSQLGAQSGIVGTQLDAALSLFEAEGFRSTGFRHSGFLNMGDQERVSIQVPSAGDYLLVGACDADCGDLDLSAFGAQGNLLDRDTNPDDAPILEWSLDRGETVVVQVDMFACSVEPCGYGLLLVRRSETAVREVDAIFGSWQQPVVGSYTLEAGFLPDPQVLEVEGWGEVANPLPGCAGYVGFGPDVALEFTAGSAGGNLFIYAVAEVWGDLNLLVRLPDGSFLCDDDGMGDLNPVVEVAAAMSGRYLIWVGTFSPSEDLWNGPPALLAISEVDPRGG